jgi:ribonuclease-3
LIAALGYTFHDERLLKSALLHSSFANERPQDTEGLPSNERLEFLGDAVLNFLSASLLYERLPDQGEGKLTSMRAALVRTATLAGFARTLRLGDYVWISMGDESARARQRPALLADLFEAVVGAIYLDGGIDAVRAFALPFLERALAAGSPADYKSLFQEWAQADRAITPYYRTVATRGPEHRREYTVEVLLGDVVVGSGVGPSKQAAAQAAAQQAFDALAGSDDGHPDQVTR